MRVCFLDMVTGRLDSNWLCYSQRALEISNQQVNTNLSDVRLTGYSAVLLTRMVFCAEPTTDSISSIEKISGFPLALLYFTLPDFSCSRDPQKHSTSA